MALKVQCAAARHPPLLPDQTLPDFTTHLLHTHTHTQSPSKLLIKCDWLTFKCQHKSLCWPALTLIKKPKAPARWRWRLASDEWFLLLYHVLFGLTPLDSVPVAQVDNRTAPAPSSRNQEWKSFLRERREKSWVLLDLSGVTYFRMAEKKGSNGGRKKVLKWQVLYFLLSNYLALGLWG